MNQKVITTIQTIANNPATGYQDALAAIRAVEVDKIPLCQLSTHKDIMTAICSLAIKIASMGNRETTQMGDWEHLIAGDAAARALAQLRDNIALLYFAQAVLIIATAALTEDSHGRNDKARG